MSALPRLSIVLACLVLPWSAFAQDEIAEPEGPDYSRAGWYVVAAGNGSFENFDDALGDVDNTIGFNTRFGARLAPEAAMELQIEWSGRFDVLGGAIDVGLLVNTVNFNVYFAEGRIQPYASVGIGYGALFVPGLSDHPGNFVARTGGGVDVYITEQIGVNLDIDYVITTKDIDGFDYASFGWGVFYRF